LMKKSFDACSGRRRRVDGTDQPAQTFTFDLLPIKC
jgi:hypothetical protein